MHAHTGIALAVLVEPPDLDSKNYSYLEFLIYDSWSLSIWRSINPLKCKENRYKSEQTSEHGFGVLLAGSIDSSMLADHVLDRKCGQKIWSSGRNCGRIALPKCVHITLPGYAILAQSWVDVDMALVQLVQCHVNFELCCYCCYRLLIQHCLKQIGLYFLAPSHHWDILCACYGSCNLRKSYIPHEPY
jgi:hypothetical protein